MDWLWETRLLLLCTPQLRALITIPLNCCCSRRAEIHHVCGSYGFFFFKFHHLVSHPCCIIAHSVICWKRTVITASVSRAEPVIIHASACLLTLTLRISGSDLDWWAISPPLTDDSISIFPFVWCVLFSRVEWLWKTLFTSTLCLSRDGRYAYNPTSLCLTVLIWHFGTAEIDDHCSRSCTLTSNSSLKSSLNPFTVQLEQFTLVCMYVFFISFS